MREDRRRLVYEVVRRFARGDSKRQIARALGIDRKTVRRMLREQEQRRAQGDDALARELGKPRAPRASKLDPYAERVDELFGEFPDITAQRVFEIIGQEGFDGGYTIVRDYVRQVRPRQSRRAYDPVTTAPGKQAQLDWSPYALPGCGIEVNSFGLVLHYSSYFYADFTADRRQPTLFRRMVAGFDDLGGVPAEVVVDSEKTIVDRWEAGEPVVNLGFLDFAAYYGFEVHVAPRADGAYKGGVERSHLIVERNFLNGRRFHDLQEARERLARWRDRFCAERNHRTKRETRRALYLEEAPLLQPLPAHPYDTSEVVWRIADGFHRVRLETNTYTVPRQYVGARLCVRANETTVRIYDGFARLLAEHERAPRQAHEDRELPEHRRRTRVDIEKVLERFQLWGEGAAAFASRLRQRQRYAGKQLSGILCLQARYRLEDILAAIEQARSHDACTAAAVERILEVRATPLTLQDVLSDRLRAEIRDALRCTPVRQRHLDAYQQLLAERREHEHVEEHDDPNDDDDSGGAPPADP